MPAGEITAALAVFALATALLCLLGFKLSAVRLIAKTLEKYERIIVPVVYICLGLYIMAESGTITKIVEMIGF